MSDFVTAHINIWQRAEIIDQAVIERFPDHASQEDMDKVVAAIEKIQGMTTGNMITTLEDYDLHPSGSAARIIVGSVLGELVLARDMGLVYGNFTVKGDRDVNEILQAEERLKGERSYSVDAQEFQRMEK